MTSNMGEKASGVPVFLLKTKSTPTDAYQDLFASSRDGDSHSYEPSFVPVLQHRFEEAGMGELRQLVRQRRISTAKDSSYGGLIFTSQRAVEAFAQVVQEQQSEVNDDSQTWPHLQDIPIYSVGPATTRALEAIPQTPPLRIFGEHTGNGEALAHFILDHYDDWYRGRLTKPPLLFLVGEQRRDIIPKTLMRSDLPGDRRIEVVETVVYGTGVMESFAGDFEAVLARTAQRPKRWVVVFSPTGCDSMLRGLGLLNPETGKVSAKTALKDERSVYIATIGPTTRSFLNRTFDLEPDVCAEKPSPEGVLQAIDNFMT